MVCEILGGEAESRYEEWEEYLIKNMNLIEERTKDIPESERPVVYWGNTWGTNFLSSVRLGAHQYEIELCGGILVAPTEGGEFPEINKEQLLSWNPDIIIIDNHGGVPDLVMENAYIEKNWEAVTAVQNEALYKIPSGVFFLDKGTSSALTLLWMAKMIHPVLFEDIDLITELKYYYETFYDYKLSDEEAEKVLSGWIDTENMIR